MGWTADWFVILICYSSIITCPETGMGLLAAALFIALMNIDWERESLKANIKLQHLSKLSGTNADGSRNLRGRKVGRTSAASDNEEDEIFDGNIAESGHSLASFTISSSTAYNLLIHHQSTEEELAEVDNIEFDLRSS